MILIAGQIESISTRRDKTLKVTIGTQELSPNQASDIFVLNQRFAYIGLKEEPFTQSEEVLIAGLKSEINQKTPSQRLRSILYKLYEQDNKGYKDFGTFYASEMERIIEHFKSKID
jgi:sugar diacid utilization regulator